MRSRLTNVTAGPRRRMNDHEVRRTSATGDRRSRSAAPRRYCEAEGGAFGDNANRFGVQPRQQLTAPAAGPERLGFRGRTGRQAQLRPSECSRPRFPASEDMRPTSQGRRNSERRTSLNTVRSDCSARIRLLGTRPVSGAECRVMRAPRGADGAVAGIAAVADLIPHQLSEPWQRGWLPVQRIVQNPVMCATAAYRWNRQ